MTVIVTGSARVQRRFDVSYDVNSLSASDIKTLAPRSFAELLGEVPGIHTEPTGGEVQNITRNRGIPTDDGGIVFQQDGLPLFGDVNNATFRGDDLNRYDLMTKTVEVVRGGPAPIYGSQAAAIVNNITVTGGPVAKGEAQITGGTTGLARVDAYEAGPLSDDTYYAVGGFLRRDNGARPDGFGPNDQGGQIRGNIKHDFADGSSVRMNVNYLNDHNVFYLPIPVANPITGQSLNPYINYFTGTMNTPALDAGTIKYVDAAGQTQTTNFGLQNGRHTEYGNLGLQYDGDFKGWSLSAKGGYTRGTVTMDALYSSNNPVDANSFTTNSKLYSINGQSALAAAQSAFGSQVTNSGYVNAATNQAYDPYSQSGLVIVSQYRHNELPFHSAQGDLSLTRQFDTTLGTHDIRVGIYGAAWEESNFLVEQNFLTNLASNPQLLNLVAYSASGSKLGNVTNNGMTTNATFLQSGEASAVMGAVYFNDTWQITKQLRMDAGVRREEYFETGWSQVTTNANIPTPGTLVTAIKALTGATDANKVDPVVNNWTTGLNYDVNNQLGAYVRFAHLDTPAYLGNLYAVQVPGVTNLNLSETHANQYELGLKGSVGKSYLYVTAFDTQYNPLTVTYNPVDVATGATISETLLAKASDIGVEIDGKIELEPGLDIVLNITDSKPEYKSLVDASGNSISGVDGKQLIREPKIHGNIRPQYGFVSGGIMYLIYARYDYTGERFVDVGNTTALPGYGEYSAGITAKMSNGWVFQVVGNNLTNAHGLTEGNPRSDVLAGQGTAVANYGRPIFGRAVRLILSKSW
ncbi:MAG TPA: TonB-dependent receptor [Burkholderiaceae bacterium]|nr:TonB-dependent receptor [Burkholderiaceae bacterium]